MYRLANVTCATRPGLDDLDRFSRIVEVASLALSGCRLNWWPKNLVLFHPEYALTKNSAQESAWSSH